MAGAALGALHPGAFVLAAVGLAVAAGMASAYHDGLAGTQPPPGVGYRADDPEVGWRYGDALRIDLSDRRFEHVVRGEANGRPCTYFEAVDDAGRIGFLVVDLPGRLPDLAAWDLGGGRARWQAPVVRLPDPLSARVGTYAFRDDEGTPPDTFRRLLAGDVPRALGLLTVSRWWVRGHWLVGLTDVHATRRRKAWERLTTLTHQLTRLAAAIPLDAYEPDDRLPAGG